MAGIERGILARQCLDRRIGTKDELTRQVAAWPEARNADGCQVTWRFTTADARIKLAHPYPRN